MLAASQWGRGERHIKWKELLRNEQHKSETGMTTVGAGIVRGSGDQNNNVWCYNCGAQGHFGHDCSWPPMCKYLYPSSPFITVYRESTHHGKGKKRKFDGDNDNYRSDRKRARRDGKTHQSPHGTKQNFKDKKKSKLPQFVQTAICKVKNKITGKKKGPSEKKKKWLERKNLAMGSKEAYENQLMAYDLKQLDQRCKSNFKRNANKKKKKVKQKIQQGGGWTDPREWRGVQVQVGKGGRQVSLQQTQGRKDAAGKSKSRQRRDRRKKANQIKHEQAQQGNDKRRLVMTDTQEDWIQEYQARESCPDWEKPLMVADWEKPLMVCCKRSGSEKPVMTGDSCPNQTRWGLGKPADLKTERSEESVQVCPEGRLSCLEETCDDSSANHSATTQLARNRRCGRPRRRYAPPSPVIFTKNDMDPETGLQQEEELGFSRQGCVKEDGVE
ncbi:Zinc finger CCHC domain-containing protein 7 [Branchiostoma belcheri]|nr:Zinc finger CCHC domain-containing protein 7 [Branchiostoma belcheri]